MGGEAGRAQVAARVARLKALSLEPQAGSHEAGALEPHLRLSDPGELPREQGPAQIWREALVAAERVDRPLELGHVALAAALRLEPPAGAQRRVESLKQPVVVEHPVEGGVGEDRVDRLVQLELGEVGEQRLVPRAATRRAPCRSSTASRPPRSPSPAEAARPKAASPGHCRSRRRALSRRLQARVAPAPRGPIPPADRRGCRSWPRPNPRCHPGWALPRSQRGGHRAAIGAPGGLESGDRRLVAKRQRRCRRARGAGGA